MLLYLCVCDKDMPERRAVNKFALLMIVIMAVVITDWYVIIIEG